MTRILWFMVCDRPSNGKTNRSTKTDSDKTGLSLFKTTLERTEIKPNVWVRFNALCHLASSTKMSSELAWAEASSAWNQMSMIDAEMKIVALLQWQKSSVLSIPSHHYGYDLSGIKCSCVPTCLPGAVRLTLSLFPCGCCAGDSTAFFLTPSPDHEVNVHRCPYSFPLSGVQAVAPEKLVKMIFVEYYSGPGDWYMS